MPRRNRPPRATPPGSPAASSSPLGGALGWARPESAADGDWLVRTVPGAHGRKTYRCPGCDHEIAPGVAHVVAWPAPDGGYGDGGFDASGSAVTGGAGGPAGVGGQPTGYGDPTAYGEPTGYGAEERRHWHTNCWQSRHRRRPGRRAAR